MESGPKLLSCLGSRPSVAKSDAQMDQGPGGLQPGGRTFENPDGLGQQLDASGPPLDIAGRAQGDADRRS